MFRQETDKMERIAYLDKWIVSHIRNELCLLFPCRHIEFYRHSPCYYASLFLDFQIDGRYSAVFSVHPFTHTIL